ncbi:hypothetical protein HY640_02680 [Candidatus Woesearchaeota archaeon]|nr:hypothetical protein [Candidatus Woesearchaeota archaeon]
MNRLQRKGALDVSINSIVVIVFAITMLGLGLAFIKGKFSEIGKTVTFPQPEIPASAEEPIVLPSEVMSVNRGTNAEVSINFYNNQNSDVTSSVIPEIKNCVGTSGSSFALGVTAGGQNVPVGRSVTYKALVVIPPDKPSGTYTCTLHISDTTKQFFLKVSGK